MDAFSSIEITSVGTIHFTQSDTYSFRIEGRERYVKNTQTTVKDGRLLIGFKDGKNKRRSNQKDGVTIWISAPDLKEVEFTGVGEFNCEKPLKLDEVSFGVKGVGEVNDADVCRVTLSGSSGRADISKGGIGGVNTDNLNIGR